MKIILKEKKLTPKGIIGIFPANQVNEDDIEVRNLNGDVLCKFLTLRQQTQKTKGAHNIALSDYILPKETGKTDYIGVFCVSCGFGVDEYSEAFEKELDPEELKKIKSLGGLDKLLEEFKKRLEEQKDRHEGGNKWVGTNGTSPFGHGGQNPEGIRVGGEGGQKSAVKVWEQRQYSNLDDSIIIGTREMKMALRRLRKFARHGNELELDMDGTIKSTAKNAGYLDIRMVPERSNAVKVIVLFDVGGSMDPYIKLCEELFSAIKTEFKHLEYFYFHNSIYESVWKDNRRRSQERFLVQDIINKYSSDYKIIVVGDATMAPYEITNSGGSIEHWNEEPSVAWINRLTEHFNNMAWLNPVPDDHWDYSSSVCILRDLFEDRMYPLTLKGLENAMGELTK